MISLVIPVYNNADNIPPLMAALERLNQNLDGELEVVLVVDGSPDNSHLRLAEALPNAGFRSQLLSLSRNFGAFSAIRAGLEAGTGDYFAVMAADLQEPPDLIVQFVERLKSGSDVVVGKRVGRNDPFLSRVMSSLFWSTYRRFVQPQVPEGGVDVFGCRREVRDRLVALCEQNSSLVGLLFWVGFRRESVEYERRAREIGKSAWTMKKKIRYLMDSMFNFTDLPVRLLTTIGFLGLLVSAVFGTVVFVGRLLGLIQSPGYAATVVVVMFFGALNCFGLGVIGGYVWRGFENSKARPNFIVSGKQMFSPPPKS